MGAQRTVEQAVILAAGRGSRLSPATDHTPKSLMPFLGLPLIAFAAAHLAAVGVRRVAVNAHHLGPDVQRYVEGQLSARFPRIEWTVSLEQELLGTGGGLANLRGWLGAEDFFVVNADAVFDAPLSALITRKQEAEADAVWMVTREPRYQALRVVETSSTGALAGLWREANPHGSTFCGVHLASAGLLATLPPTGASCVVRDGYLPWMANGACVTTWETKGFWADTGTPDRYVDAHTRGLTHLTTWRRLGLF